MAETKLNLSRASVLVVDADPYVRSLTVQLLRGLGNEKPTLFERTQPALEHLTNVAVDVCLGHRLINRIQILAAASFIRAR